MTAMVWNVYCTRVVAIILCNYTSLKHNYNNMYISIICNLSYIQIQHISSPGAPFNEIHLWSFTFKSNNFHQLGFPVPHAQPGISASSPPFKWMWHPAWSVHELFLWWQVSFENHWFRGWEVTFDSGKVLFLSVTFLRKVSAQRLSVLK